MRPHILVVDDAKAVRLLAEKSLAAYACDVSGVTNGYNALYAMEKTLPDLLLLDVSMPIMNGLELLEMLKSKPELAAIPVIMLTSPADHTVADRIAALGVAGTLIKPFTPEALLAKVLAVLPLASAQP
jgi:CheY-like chemotaxis protein